MKYFVNTRNFFLSKKFLVNFIYSCCLFASMRKKEVLKKKGIIRKKKKIDYPLKHKYFWLILSLLIIIPLLIIFSSPHSLLGQTIQDIAFIKGGGFLQLSGTDVKGVEMIKVTFSQDVKDSSLKLEEDSQLPFAGAAYSKFKLYSDDATLSQKVKEVEMNLNLKADELTAWNLNQDNVRLYHEGKELATEKLALAKQAGYLYYQATAPGLGNFVIGNKAEEKKAAEPEEKIISPASEEVEESEILPEPEIKKEIEKPFIGKALEPPAPPQESLFSKAKSLLRNLGFPVLVPLITLLIFLIIIACLLKAKKSKTRQKANN